ncbi:hypothetical protein ACQP1G_20490 [Nocardia sp. CA-107356]|uniref:hypothetical protein n=1 Tax=Nocardia sp. CA-107356 TaxID=3239972 RepID=UPI003D942F2F
MNPLAQQRLRVGDPPDGVECPGDDTPVLLRRELLSGTGLDGLSRFGEDRWHLNEAIFEADATALSVNFAVVPAPLRLAAKHYVWQLINTDSPPGITRMRIARSSIRSIPAIWQSFREFLLWLHNQQITEFCQVTADLLDGYLTAIGDADIPLERKYRRITEVRRLWSYRSVLPEPMRLPILPPLGGDAAYELLGKTTPSRENLTPRIGKDTMQPLLSWSLRFVEDFSADILAAHTEYLFMRSRSTEGRHERGRLVRSPVGQAEQRMTDYWHDCAAPAGCYPAKSVRTGPSASTGPTSARSWNTRAAPCPAGRMLLDSGIPVADDAYLDTPITGQLDGTPWHDGPISYNEAATLATHLSTACLVIVAYLSGARPGEVLNLRRGCIEHDAAADLWLMSGICFKNVVDASGNKLPAGALRRDPWVVVEPVADAVAVLERLHDHPLLFPSRIEAHLRRTNTKRKGQARAGGQIALDLAAFVAWVNDHGDRRGVRGIPTDPRGQLNISRFRRTLAWFVRRRPRGLVAGAIQYGHVHTRLLQGYAGDYGSGFPDEYAFEDFLARLEKLAEDEQALQDGEHVSGPASDAYRQRVSTASRQFVGYVLTSVKQARDLVGNPLLQIFHGKGMTCVFDPKQAACLLRGEAQDPLTTPDTDDCRPRCQNIARTDRDVAEIRSRREELANIIADSLAPPIRHRREQHELDRLDTILENHQ